MSPPQPADCEYIVVGSGAGGGTVAAIVSPRQDTKSYFLKLGAIPKTFQEETPHPL